MRSHNDHRPYVRIHDDGRRDEAQQRARLFGSYRGMVRTSEESTSEMEVMERDGVIEALGPGHMHPDIASAVKMYVAKRARS